ncbi:MAG: PAS domain-containing sensor histidine kinase [Gammaproteobacteria bacterium]|nr:PAS domain-containing sensor histidine kinase [Gammaproteobacteria bacterium]
MDTTDAAGASQSQSQANVAEQNWKLLSLYNYYRLIISTAAAVLALSGAALPPFGLSSPGLFLVASIVYAIVSLVSLETIRRQRPDFETQATFQIFADIALITFLMHASGGLTSGLGLLLLVAVAGSSLMLGKRMTVLYAALATIAALVEHSWDWWTGVEVNVSDVVQGYPQVGMLGIGLFATATLGYTLATRLRATEALAERRGVDLANLSQLNALIIQRMHSGVLVCDRDGRIRMMNQTATNFLGLPADSMKTALASASAELANQLAQSIANPTRRTRSPVKTGRGYTVIPRFIVLGEPPTHTGTLIFLEDAAVLKRQAQQLKMAALARLTASIAHEIRNPLGAIANAAQLLGENAPKDREENRLVKIIGDQSRRMNVIVENITQLSRRDQVSPVMLPLQPWLEEFMQHFAETLKIPREAFAVYGAEDLQVCIDPDQFYQVVGNLSQNALRHSPPFTGNLLVKFQGGTNSDGRPFLDVIDWGRGVPQEIQDQIFEPFFTTTPKGTGLGLYIARELCEGNGATLDFHPGSGGIGSRFHVTFARAEECGELGIA